MRYADGGGLSAEGRARRENVRLQAARLFEQDLDARQVAEILRVSTESVYQWRRAWRAGGDAYSTRWFRRARSMSRQIRPTTVVSHARRSMIASASLRRRRSQACWTASSASLTEPSMP
jgi:transposase